MPTTGSEAMRVSVGRSSLVALALSGLLFLLPRASLLLPLLARRAWPLRCCAAAVYLAPSAPRGPLG